MAEKTSSAPPMVQAPSIPLPQTATTSDRLDGRTEDTAVLRPHSSVSPSEAPAPQLSPPVTTYSAGAQPRATAYPAATYPAAAFPAAQPVTAAGDPSAPYQPQEHPAAPGTAAAPVRPSFAERVRTPIAGAILGGVALLGVGFAAGFVVGQDHGSSSASTTQVGPGGQQGQGGFGGPGGFGQQNGQGTVPGQSDGTTGGFGSGVAPGTGSAQGQTGSGSTGSGSTTTTQ